MTNRVKDLAALGKIDLQAPVKTMFVTDDVYLHERGPVVELHDQICIGDIVDASAVYLDRAYRSDIHKLRRTQFYILTADNKFVRITTKSNKVTRGGVLDYALTFPEGTKCIYFARVHGRDFIELKEYDLYRKVFKAYPRDESVVFLKIFLVYEHLYPTRTLDFIFRDENIKIIDEINNFPKDDPEALYWEIAKHTRFESYTVTRDGERIQCIMVDGARFDRGYYDFINPETYQEICESDDIMLWQRDEMFGKYGFVKENV